MFLKSISSGIQLFALPQVWWLLIPFIGLYLVFAWVIRLATHSKESQDAAAPGCLVPIVGILFQGLWMALFVLLLLPILLGIESEVSWNSVAPLVFVAIRAGILGTLILTLLTFLPKIGPLFASSPGLESFLLGSMTFRIASPAYLEAILGKGILHKNFYPGFLPTLGYFFFTILLTRIFMFLSHRVAAGIKNPEGKNFPRIILHYIGPSFDLLGGILPFFMYTQYVRWNLFNG